MLNDQVLGVFAWLMFVMQIVLCAESRDISEEQANSVTDKQWESCEVDSGRHYEHHRTAFIAAVSV